MATKKPKPRGDQLYTSLMSFYGAQGQFVPAGSEWRGDHAVVQLHPMHFSLSADGQAGIDAATAALRADIGEAAKNRERMWYGEKAQPEPETPPRVVCVKRFNHGRDVIEPGSIWLASHAIVASAPSAFVAVED
jgi:hypothetical protein